MFIDSECRYLKWLEEKKNIHVTMEKTDQVYTAELDYNHLDEKEK